MTTETSTPLHPAEQIVSLIAHFYGISIEELKNGDRHQRLVRARHMAMYVLRDRQKMSFPEIGDRIGNRDHTTVMFAVRKMQNHLEQDAELRKELLCITLEMARSRTVWERLTLLRPFSGTDGERIRCTCRGLDIKPGVELFYDLERQGSDIVVSLNLFHQTLYKLEFTETLRPEQLPIAAIDVAAFSDPHTPWDDIVLNSLIRLLSQSAELHLSYHTFGTEAEWIVATVHCGEFTCRARCKPHELEPYLHYE